MARKTTTLLLLLIISVLFAAFRWMEDDFSKIIIEKVKKYTETYPQEKAYLHIDKPYYMPGDTLWFRAWLVEAGHHRVDTASTVLYVDLVEVQTKKVVALRRVALAGGTGHGDITLSDSLPGGTYTVRAYTNWMRNFSDDFFFHKDITLVTDAISTHGGVQDGPLDIQFFPEGGHLVEGIEGKVAFKAINPSGLGTDVECHLVNQAGDTLYSFQSYHLGMGSFPLKPLQGQRYKLLVREKERGGSFVSYELPAVQPEGFSLRVDNITNRTNVKVFIYNNLPASQTGELTLLAHTRGTVVFSAKGNVQRKGISVAIPRSQLPEGITHFTLFNEQNRPVCERLVFVDHKDRLMISVQPVRSSYRPREKTELEVMVKDTAGNPVETAVSLAVLDAGQIAEKPFESNVVSDLLLVSDLRGNIEQPASYFDPENKFAAVQLDLLMLTQGWSRFVWSDILEDKQLPTPYFVEHGISVSGQVLKPNRKLPGKVGLTVMLTTDSTRMFLTSEANEAGKFEIYNLDIRDSTGILIQAAKQKSGGGQGSRNLIVSVNPFLTPPVKTARIPFKAINQDSRALEEYLRRTKEYLDIERQIRANREKLLKEVVIKAKKEEERDNRKIYTRADATIKVTPQTMGGAITVFDLIRGRVAGVNVTGGGQDVTVQIRGNMSLSRGVIEPLFLLDGVPTTKDALYGISVNDVDYIDVLKGASAAIYGSQGGGGVIGVFTKRGNSNYDWTKEEAEGTRVEKIAGYNIEREFYVPRYEVSNPDNVRPDFRSTVFWAPMVRTDKEGKAKVSYFNTDAKTTISVHAQGLTWTGQAGSAMLSYKVN